LIWNRLRYVKNPDTGKRVSRLNPESQWITTDVPHLRIIPDDLWSAAKERQKHTRHAIATTGKLSSANRPRYLFSGLTKCGVCGAGFIMGSANRLCCFGARDQGTCSNKLTIRRDEVEARVLKALQEKLLRQDVFEEFCDEFTREMNRLRMDHRASLSAAERELERVQNDIRRVIEAIKNGFAGPDLRAEWDALQERKAALQSKLDSADEPPPLLHPGMAELYRQKVTDLAQALEHPDTRTEAAEAIRGLIDAIVLTPAAGALEAHVVRRGRRVQAEAGGQESGLQIELKGNLAAMLSAAQNATRSPETGDLELQIAMVAGACNRRSIWAQSSSVATACGESSGWVGAITTSITAARRTARRCAFRIERSLLTVSTLQSDSVAFVQPCATTRAAIFSRHVETLRDCRRRNVCGARRRRCAR
jgi:hypothetical protein